MTDWGETSLFQIGIWVVYAYCEIQQ